MLSYIPFIEPMSWVHTGWYFLLIPLAFGLSVIYKAMRTPNLAQFWPQVALMTTQIVCAMIGLALALTLIIQVIIPTLPAE